MTRGGASIEGALVSVDGQQLAQCKVVDHEDGTYTLYYEAKKV